MSTWTAGSARLDESLLDTLASVVDVPVRPSRATDPVARRLGLLATFSTIPGALRPRIAGYGACEADSHRRNHVH